MIYKKEDYTIHRYFQVGVVSFMAFPQMMRGESEQTREYLREVACDDYFDAIEINWIKDPQQRKKAAEVLRASHMKVCYGAQPRLLTTGLNPNALQEETGCRRKKH